MCIMHVYNACAGVHCYAEQHIATHCDAQQHTAAHCSTLQHTAACCSTLQHTAACCSTLQHTAAHCSTLQHTATHCNTLHHTAFVCTVRDMCAVRAESTRMKIYAQTHTSYTLTPQTSKQRRHVVSQTLHVRTKSHGGMSKQPFLSRSTVTPGTGISFP